jgi:hypothetical protein
MLSVYEELFLLALDEENGNFLPFTRKTIPYGLVGAIFAELALLEKVCSNEKQRLIVNDPTPTGNPILDEVVDEVHASDKHRKLSYWISHFSEKPKKLRFKLGENMAERSLIDQDENRFFWRSAPQEGQEQGVSTKFKRKIPLRSMILGSQESADPHSLALLNVTSACNLLSLIFTEDELPVARRMIHEKVIQAALKNPIMETIEKIEYAIASSIEDDSD